MKTLTIVIVNYRVKLFVEQLLIGLRRATERIDADVWVVDNASGDGSIDYLRPLFPEVNFIENTDNVGFSRANNQAIARSESRYVLLINPDTRVEDDTLDRCLAFMEHTPQAGAAGVRMVDGEGHFLPESKRGFPSPWVSFCRIFGLAALFPRSPQFGKYYLRYLDEHTLHRVDILAGAFMFIRREALDRCGALDERFFMYGEDIDLSVRIASAGYDNYYLPFTIVHFKSESTQKNSFRYVYLFHKAMYQFYRKHYPRAGVLLGGLVMLGILVRAFAALLKRVATRA